MTNCCITGENSAIELLNDCVNRFRLIFITGYGPGRREKFSAVYTLMQGVAFRFTRNQVKYAVLLFADVMQNCVILHPEKGNRFNRYNTLKENEPDFSALCKTRKFNLPKFKQFLKKHIQIFNLSEVAASVILYCGLIPKFIGFHNRYFSFVLNNDL